MPDAMGKARSRTRHHSPPQRLTASASISQTPQPRRATTMRFEGTIQSWNDERGFGFIGSTLGGQDIFVHIKAFKGPPGKPRVGQRVTFAAYAMDRSAARQGAWRTPEKTLHMLSLIGGWPGALLAQQWLRHKSSKAEFRSVFWVTVALNLAAFTFLASPQTQQLARSALPT